MFRFCFHLLSWILFAQTGIRASQLLDEMNAQYVRDYGITIVADGEVYPLAAGPSIDAQNTGKNNGDMVLYFLRKEFAKYPGGSPGSRSNAMRASMSIPRRRSATKPIAGGRCTMSCFIFSTTPSTRT